MPVATVRTAQGGISGFVVKNGASLELVDGNFENPVVLGTFAAPIGVAVALSVGTTQGYPSGQLYVVDGNIVYVDYAGHTVSASLFAIPNWTPRTPKHCLPLRQTPCISRSIPPLPAPLRHRQ